MIELSGALVLSLAEDHERRSHINEHFSDIGITSYSFVEAIPWTDPIVAEAYDNGQVPAYPPCFRCGKNECDCPNNVLIPQQIANWLSFQAIWRRVAHATDQYFLICEDDVAFHTNGLELLNDMLASFVPEQEQVLIRLANSGEEPFRDLSGQNWSIGDTQVMSNAAHILNGALAARLLREAPRFLTTSDIWLHHHMAQHDDIQMLTLEPLLATDLSYNRKYARFRSQIHPKGIDAEDERRQGQHVKRIETAQAYAALKREWF